LEQAQDQSLSFNIIHGNVPDVFSLDRISVSEGIFQVVAPDNE
jgi:hypothetical protein